MYLVEIPKGADTTPIMEMTDGKITHTLHLLFHSQDRYRHGIIVTHNTCDHDEFAEVDCEWEYEGITVFRHLPSNLLVLSCEKGVKTWVGEAVADAIYDFVSFYLHHLRISIFIVFIPSINILLLTKRNLTPLCN